MYLKSVVKKIIILTADQYPIDNRKLIIYDDLMNAPSKTQDKITTAFTNGRHHNISPMYLSQSYYAIPQKIRLNASHMVLYKPTTRNNLSLIARENLLDPLLFKSVPVSEQGRTR